MSSDTAFSNLPPMALLNLLADGELHSGQELATVLGVSRTAVWKQLSKLEALDLELRSQPGKGYCLVGGLDLLDAGKIMEALSPTVQRQGLALEVLGVVDSTNAYLLRQPPAPTLVACLAECQTAGRGRRGRQWISPFARNIYLSLRMSVESGVGALEGLSLAVGVVIARALSGLGIEGVQLKWPNDILWRGRKLGGILIEITGDPSGVCHLVVGLGLNVGASRSMENGITQPWVALNDIAAFKMARSELATALLNHLAPMLSHYESTGFVSYHADWEKLNAHANQEVDLHLGSGVTRGTLVGVTDSGALILETTQGRQIFHGGEVSLRSINDSRA